MEICNDCQKPIVTGQTSYVSNPAPGTIHHYHSKCGDALGIKAAVAAERERCAKIAEAIDSGRGNEKEIAKAIRENG